MELRHLLHVRISCTSIVSMKKRKKNTLVGCVSGTDYSTSTNFLENPDESWVTLPKDFGKIDVRELALL